MAMPPGSFAVDADGREPRVAEPQHGKTRKPHMSRAVTTDEGSRIVVIAASTGGLDALSRILSQLAPTFPAAIAIVQHRSTSYPTLLAQLLQQRTKLRVKNAEDGEEIHPGIVYVAPPGIHLVVDSTERFGLVDGLKVKHSRPSGDVLFASAAEAFESRVIAVVLTGGDGDGSAGISVVKRRGGTVISQDAGSAAASGMPRSAIATGDVDYVLPLEHIASALEELAGRGRTRSDL
jgi:two-component system, chemotaxis family, protein-glutamate methylesterase/glutaminase